jgi:hypothetical protein
VFAKTSSPFVSIIWEKGCNVAELGYIRPGRGILESNDTLAKDRGRQRVVLLETFLSAHKALEPFVVRFFFGLAGKCGGQNRKIDREWRRAPRVIVLQI